MSAAKAEIQFQAGSPPHQQELLHHLVHMERATHNAGQDICQCFNFGRLWSRTLRQGLAMCDAGGVDCHNLMSQESKSLYQGHELSGLGSAIWDPFSFCVYAS
eukprot:Em0032g2a